MQVKNSNTILREDWSVFVILILTPLLLYLVSAILPTHDDWASLTRPTFESLFTKERFFFYGSHWRPFDSIIGYVAGRHPQSLFPAFHHVLVVIGHAVCSLSVLRLLKVLRFSAPARNLAAVFFFITPAAMATVSAVDSQNQVYALVFGILSFLLYVRVKRRKYILWAVCIFLSALWKENGLMWALVCPLLAYGFDFIDRKTLRKDLLAGIIIMAVYALAIVLQPKDVAIHPEYVPDLIKVMKNMVKFLFTSFVTVDYVYLLHQPHRNLLLAAFTFLMSLPFLFCLLHGNAKVLAGKKMLTVVVCLMIAVAPHLFTVFSMMHTYAGLAMIAVMVALLAESGRHRRHLMLCFLLFVIDAVAIDVHLIGESIHSGLVGKSMAVEAVTKTGKPVRRVFVVIIEDDYPKLSSFCVIPSEAFGWGLAARHETNYQWPQAISDTTLLRSRHARDEAMRLGMEKLAADSFDCVWIVDHEKVDVLQKGEGGNQQSTTDYK